MTERKRELEVETVRDAARMLRCISHPVRLKILGLLDREGEQNVTSIHETLELEQAVASQHLTLMRDKGVLASRREGVHVYYHLADERVVKVLDCLRGGRR